jgi:hypothetical protein
MLRGFLTGSALAVGCSATAALAFLGLRALIQPDAWPEDWRGLAWLLVAFGSSGLLFIAGTALLRAVARWRHARYRRANRRL